MYICISDETNRERERDRERERERERERFVTSTMRYYI